MYQITRALKATLVPVFNMEVYLTLIDISLEKKAD